MHSWPHHMDSMYMSFSSCLTPLIGRKISVQTVRGSVTGRLYHIHPDHILIQSGGAPFFVQTRHILWAVPISKSRKYRMYPYPYY